MNLTVLVLRNVDIEASSSSESMGSWEIMMTQTGAARVVSVLVSWYTMSTDAFFSRTSTSSSITISEQSLTERRDAMALAISSVEKPRSGYPLS